MKESTGALIWIAIVIASLIGLMLVIREISQNMGKGSKEQAPEASSMQNYEELQRQQLEDTWRQKQMMQDAQRQLKDLQRMNKATN